jgi:phospholipid/cholesterol/gamma-HCH transport system substrate-binding protein
VTVGLLVIIVAAISYFLIRSTSESPRAKGYAVWGLFKDASGLFEKSRVQTAGISIGQIQARELDPAGTNKAKVTIQILPNIKLYENAVVAKKSASLLGEYYLEIDPGSEIGVDRKTGERRQMRVLGNGDQIMTVIEPTDMGQIMADVGTLLPILHDILDDVRRLTSGPVTNIAENVNQLIETNSEVLERLLKRVDDIAAHLQDVTASEAGDVKESLRNVREITESIKSLVGSTNMAMHGGPDGGAMRASVDRLQSTLTSLDHTMQNLDKVTSRIEKGEGTIGRLASDDTIARNVEDITEDAGTLVRSITKLQTIVGLRSEYNFLSASLKNYLSIYLVPRPDKFYLIELVDDPRGYRTKTTTVTNASNQPAPVVTDTITTTQQLRFTLMFGKRVPITPSMAIAGRFGIKESTGGFGADLYLLDDRLSLSVDVFDTLVNKYPRVKATGAIAVWKRNLYVVGGADDLANYTRARAGAGGGFDWFLGASLVFNDEDLKSLLLFGSGALSGAASSGK